MALKPINEVMKKVSRPEKVLQFGEGGFLRAFVDWQIDIANEKAGFNGNIVIVQPLEKGMIDAMNAQDNLYTTVLRGMKDGKPTVETRCINSVSRSINPYTNYDEYIAQIQQGNMNAQPPQVPGANQQQALMASQLMHGNGQLFMRQGAGQPLSAVS